MRPNSVLTRQRLRVQRLCYAAQQCRRRVGRAALLDYSLLRPWLNRWTPTNNPDFPWIPRPSRRFILSLPPVYASSTSQNTDRFLQTHEPNTSAPSSIRRIKSTTSTPPALATAIKPLYIRASDISSVHRCSSLHSTLKGGITCCSACRLPPFTWPRDLN